MGKKKTSRLPKKYSDAWMKANDLERHDPLAGGLKDPKLVREILIQALMGNDLETFEDVLIGHLRAASKSKLAAKTGLGRQTLYDLIDKDKEFNPTLQTLGAILKGIAA